MRVAFDTNILAYAEGVGDVERRDASLALIERIPVEVVMLPAQTLGELFRVLTGKAAREAVDARAAILDWADTYDVIDSTWRAFQSGMDLCVDHRLQVWDALIVAAAAENGCRLVLTEDLQHEFTWRGVTIINPYEFPEHPLLLACIGS